MYVKDFLHDKSILIVGAGSTGKSISNYLVSININFKIYDEVLTELNGLPIISQLSENFDIAIISPGWRREHQVIQELQSRKCQIISELDFAWMLKEEISPNQIWLGVTGTNGKTTTVQMLESILNYSEFKGISCGNVGLTVTDAVTSREKFDVLAIELSSFQIDWSDLPNYKSVAILNISDDHIDWHETFDRYASAKTKLLERSGIAILNLNDPEVALRSSAFSLKKVFYSLDTPQAGELGLVEDVLVDRAFGTSPETAEVIAELSDINPAIPHNVSNALAAAGLALTLGIPHPTITMGLREFKLDRHRMELIKSKDGIDWVNDSKATNPHAARAALASYKSCIWIAGGLAKGANMADLIRKSSSRIKSAILIGTDRELIALELQRLAPQVEIIRIDKESTSEKLMEDVVKSAKSMASSGDTVLLAPACASMDQFKSYAERGSLFSDAVQRLV